MRSRKKTIFGLLPPFLCLVAMLLVACGEGGGVDNGSHRKAADSKQIFVFTEVGVADIATFDPALANDTLSLRAIDTVFTGLVQLDDNLKVQGVLAQSWDESSDGLTWTFHLRPNLKFSDGTPLTSKDVAYSIDRSLQPAVKSTTSPIYEALILDSDKLNTGKIKTIINDSLMTPDDNTIIIKTNKKAAYFLDALTYSCSYVVERRLIDKYGTSWTDHLTEGGGEGPWKVAKYDHSTGITFVPNQYYHGKKPQLKELYMPFYKDIGTQYNAYQAAQVDIATIPAASVDQARTKTREFQKIPLLQITYITMNYLIKPFDNIHIRQAFALAINKDVLVSSVYKNTQIPTNHIVPQGMPGYNANLKGPAGVAGTAGDANMAKQLLRMGLQEEGWSSVSQMPSIKLTYRTGSKTTENAMEAVIQMLQNVLGVAVEANPIDPNELLHEASASVNNPHGLQMWRLFWVADYPDPQDWLTLQFDKGVPNNQWNYGQNNSADAAKQQETQKLMEQADANPDQDARLQQYNQAEQQVINDVAWIPLIQGAEYQLVKPCVQNLITNPQELIPPDDWGSIYKSTDTPCANASVTV